MKTIVVIFIIAFVICSCKKQPLNNGGTQSNNINSGNTITYKLSIKQAYPGLYFKRVMTVYNSQWVTLQDTVSALSNSYSFTMPSGHANYGFSYQSSQSYLTDSIRLQILVGNVVKRDTIVSGAYSMGSINLFY